MLKVAHRFLLVLIVFAVIGGPMTNLAQPVASSTATAMADMPCDTAMPMADAVHDTPMAPCKGLTPECIKQMGCVANVALPARLASIDAVFAFSPITYWSAWSLMAGVAHKPEPLPPRTT